MKRLLTVFIASLLVTSCSQVRHTPQNYTGPVAYINDASKKVSLTKFHYFELAMVDDDPIYSSSTCAYDGSDNAQEGLNTCATRHPVPAGKHRLHIRAVNYVTVPFFTLFNNIYKAEGDVYINLEAGKEYFVRGEITSDRAAVWIEDSKGDLVSHRIETL